MITIIIIVCLGKIVLVDLKKINPNRTPNGRIMEFASTAQS